MKKKNKGNKEIYEFYRIKCKQKEIKPKSPSLCKLIWKDCNLKIKEILLKESDSFRMPYGLGILKVRKKKIDYSKIPDNKLRIDFGSTRKLGYTVFFTNDYVYRLIWEKYSSRIVHKTLYFFDGCKDIKRDLAKCIKIDKIDYFE